VLRDVESASPVQRTRRDCRVQLRRELRAGGSVLAQELERGAEEPAVGREGSHIHFTVESQQFGRQWAPMLFFEDDSLVTPRQRRQSAEAGEFGAVREITVIDGIQHVHLKIRMKEQADF
jgi:hypothetical protein